MTHPTPTPAAALGSPHGRDITPLSDADDSNPTPGSPLGRGIPPGVGVLDSSCYGCSGSPNSVAPRMLSSHSFSLLSAGSSCLPLVTRPTDVAQLFLPHCPLLHQHLHQALLVLEV